MEFALAIITFLALILTIFLVVRDRQRMRDVRAREQEVRRRMYELAILKEIGDRVGYSLNIEKVADVIIGSLDQFIEYGAASYILVEQDRFIFKSHLDKTVSRDFIEDIKVRMTQALAELLPDMPTDADVEETITGAIVSDNADEPVRSFFNIPLVIGERVMGVLTVADTKAGLYQEEEMTLLYKIVHQASRSVTQLENVVQTEQRKLNAMVESMAEGVIMTDDEYRVVVVNPAARKALALEDEQPSIFDMIDRLEGRFDIRGKLEESVKLNKELSVNDVYIRGRFYQILVSPVVAGEKGEVFGGVVLLHDITHEKEVEKMREDFTSMMVHELRSPLDGIKKMGDLLLSDDKIRQNKEMFEEYIGMIHNGSSDMLELVNDLLDVAKLESGKFEIRKNPNDIREVVAQKLKFFDTNARSAKIDLASHIDENVPDAVRFDDHRVGQVLSNLLSNSLKFTNPGGRVRVDAFVHREGESVVIEAQDAGVEWKVTEENETLKSFPDAVVVAVTDTGEGISKENQKQLFNKFKQFESSSRSEEDKGTGLGLVIAQGIVEAHEGTLNVASEEGVGTTFYFTLKIHS